MKIFLFILFFLVPSFSLHAWANWAGNQVCNPSQIFYPSHLNELKSILKKAQKNKKQVRAIGTGHSWSNILCADYMVNTDKLNKVLSIDTEKKQIRVEAGIKLNTLIKILAEHELALPNQPAITLQSIAGVVSTATHGSGHTGTMADFVIKIELLTADGTVYEISKNKHPDWFGAARMSIGSLGIIYALTLQCVPLFRVKHNNYKTNWQTIIKEYETLNKKNDFFSFVIDLDTKNVVIDIFNKTQEMMHNSFWLDLKKYTYNWFIWFINNLTALFPQLFNISFKTWVTYGTDFEQIEYGYEALSGAPSPYYLEEEIAVMPKQLVSALEKVFEVVAKYQKQGIQFGGIVCRFVKAEQDIYLSPAAQQDVVFISLTTPVEKKYMPFFRDYFQAMKQFNGRPHWGKINFLTKKDVNQLYGENFTRFLEVRKKLDPEGMFSNEFTRTIFGW